MKKLVYGILIMIFISCDSHALAATSQIKGEVLSINLDTHKMTIRMTNAFMGAESTEQLTWVMDSPEDRIFRELKPGHYVFVNASKDRFGRYFVSKVIKVRKRQANS